LVTEFWVLGIIWLVSGHQNTQPGDSPDLFTVYWSILSVFVASVVLLSTSDKTDPKFVFATFQNETGWNDGIAWILGLLQSALSLIGYDAVLPMTEEMPTPSRDAPLAMVYAVGVGGTT
jgi:amino acid transporter